MNEDKELEEAIETIKNSYVMSTNHCLDDENVKLRQAIVTALQALKDSIPKKKIENKIKAYEKIIDDISESEQYSHEIPLYRHDIQVLQELLKNK